MTQNCGTCKYSYQQNPACLAQLGCWKDKEASGFKYTFNLKSDGKDCDKFERKTYHDSLGTY